METLVTVTEKSSINGNPHLLVVGMKKENSTNIQSTRCITYQ